MIKNLMKDNTKKLAVFMSMIALGVLSFELVGGTTQNALSLEYKEYNRIDFTFNPTISISLSPSGLTIPRLSPGSAEDSNIIGVSVSTNSITGLQLSATVGRHIGDNDPYDNTDLVDVENDDNSSKFSSLNGNVDHLENFGINEWGYSYCVLALADCGNTGPNWVSGNIGSATLGYDGLPKYDSLGVVLASTNSVTDSTVMFKIGAKAGDDQVAGVYTNIVNFATMINVVTTKYTLTYNDTSGEATVMPENVGLTETTDDIIAVPISNTIPERTAYAFNGWCTVQTSDGNCSGNVYRPGEKYNVGIGGTREINLYAMWSTVDFNTAFESFDKEKLNGYYRAQDISGDICRAVSIGEETQLIDLRDNKVYYIAKLADNKCWMTQNLDHDIDSNYDYNSSNTDIEQSKTWVNTITGTEWNMEDQIEMQSYDPGNKCWKLNSSDIENCSQAGNHYHLGNYYSWTAAAATTDSNAITSNQSICPAGWTLPQMSSDNNDFVDLISKYGWNNDYAHINDAWKKPLYFALSGWWAGGYSSIGSTGEYWFNTRGYYSDFYDNGQVIPYNYDYLTFGRSVRCVAR